MMPPSDELCKRACYLRSENLKEREIANALGTDVTAVSRLLKEGRKRGLYSETHQVRLHLGSKDRRRLTLKYYPERIRQELTCKLSSISSNVPEIHVFPDKDLPKLAATELASIFEDVLNRDLKGSRIAVAWGSNLSDVARELKDVWTYSPRPGTDDGCGSSQNPTIGFLPARGDLLHDKLPVRVGPSRICASISSTVNGKH